MSQEMTQRFVALMQQKGRMDVAAYEAAMCQLLVQLQASGDEALDRQDRLVLADVYHALGHYDQACRCLAALSQPTQKEIKKRHAYEADYRRWGHRRARPLFGEVRQAFAGLDLPHFKYCPEPLKHDIFKVDVAVVCGCCGQETAVYYQGGLYAVDDVDYLCPECIHGGVAAQKFDGSFQHDLFNDEGVVDPSYVDEVMHRTPGYCSWQGNNWPAHCDDYCAFHGYVGATELEDSGIWDEMENLTDMDAADLKQYMRLDGDLQGYLFRCLKCETWCLYADMS
ncbi:MAG: CbrC family protein [Neisseriaceae bacterium]|nr:CbrC family protein [Neisseriaceae bacterium]